MVLWVHLPLANNVRYKSKKLHKKSRYFSKLLFDSFPKVEEVLVDEVSEK